MNSKEEDRLMMDIAARVGQCSRDEKTRVGCVIAKGSNILALGFNGTPSGFSNDMRGPDGKTHSWVIHAEKNALAKLAKSTLSGEGATAYCTLSPCMTCATLLYQAGIVRICYRDTYKHTESLGLLESLGIIIEQI